MGQKRGGFETESDVLGRRRPGAPYAPPARRVIRYTRAEQNMGDPNEVPEATVTPSPNMWFNTTAEFDRWYRRLHPLRHSLSRRLARIERQQRIEREIETIRDLTQGRHGILQQVGNPRFRQELVERNLQRQQDEDPLNQFNRRIRRRFEQAMEREANDLADELQNLRISEPPPQAGRIGPVQEVD